LLAAAFFSGQRTRAFAAHFFIGIQLQQHLRRRGNFQFAQRARGENEERDAGFHVEHARPPERPSASRNGMVRSVPIGHTVSGMAQRQHLPALLSARQLHFAHHVLAEFSAGVSLHARMGATVSDTSSTKRFTAAGSSLGDSHSTNWRSNAAMGRSCAAR
jgi:hypothetical protein